MSDEVVAPAPEARKGADLLTFARLPYRMTPEIVARIMYADWDSIERMACYVQYKGGRTLLIRSAGVSPEFLGQGAGAMLSQAGTGKAPPKKA